MDALIQTVPPTEVYVDGVHHIEVIDNNVRVVFFRWHTSDDGKTWRKVGGDIAIVCPLASIQLSGWGDVRIKRFLPLPQSRVEAEAKIN